MSILDNYYNLKQAEDKNSTKDLLNYYVGFLRLVYFVHQNAHWKCKCSSFYANHLMFQRLYEDAQARVDTAAEKLIGILGVDALEEEEHAVLIAKNAKKYVTGDHSYVQGSLDVENDFIKLSQKVYDEVKENGDMTLGLDDMIMANASLAETAVYLLKQANPE